LRGEFPVSLGGYFFLRCVSALMISINDLAGFSLGIIGATGCDKGGFCCSVDEAGLEEDPAREDPVVFSCLMVQRT